MSDTPILSPADHRDRAPVLLPPGVTLPELLSEIARLKAERNRMVAAIREVIGHLRRREEFYGTLDRVYPATGVAAHALSLQVDVLRSALPVEELKS